MVGGNAGSFLRQEYCLSLLESGKFKKENPCSRRSLSTVNKLKAAKNLSENGLMQNMK